MKIADIRWYQYRVPFINGFRTAHGTLTERVGLFVEILTNQDITGIGEIAPLPEFSGGDLAQAQVALPSLVARLQGKTLDVALHDVVQIAETAEANASVHCGIEMALLDALGKHEGKSVSRLLTPTGSTPKTRVAVNMVIGGATLDTAVQAASTAVNNGYQCIKLKVGVCTSIDEELERIAEVRAAIGPGRQLRLDANEAWTVEQAYEILSRCTPYAIQYIEQPVPAQQLEQMRLLRCSTPIPIAADEAILGLNSARKVLENQAADVLIIKPQLAGGLHIARRIIQEAAAYGVQSVPTSTLETGVGIAATLHLAAAMPEITMACGLSTLSLLAKSFLKQDLTLVNDYMNVPNTNGLGITIDDTDTYSS